MKVLGWVILAAVNFPVYWVLGYLIFRSWRSSGEAVVFLFLPGWFTIARGEYSRGVAAELKLGAWVVLCAGCVWAEGMLISIFGR